MRILRGESQQICGNRQLKLHGMLLSAMKSGSTWLAQHCSKHPDLFVIPGQEITTTPEKLIENIDFSGYSNEKLIFGKRI